MDELPERVFYIRFFSDCLDSRLGGNNEDLFRINVSLVTA